MKSTVVCFSHLRWAFTFQRPNHLMSRFSDERRVFYIEEPVFDSPVPAVSKEDVCGVTVCVPHLPDTNEGRSEALLTRLIADFLAEHGVVRPVLWFYTPMALPLADGIPASLVVYDCMDELSMFDGAPPELLARERALMDRADLVFTGGHSLYEAKRSRHPLVYAFPSSVDVGHFSPASQLSTKEPVDQRHIPRARVGFFGVIDERMDVDLLSTLAKQRPQYQFVLIGPVVKISEHVLPRAPNIHYLGPRTYAELPAYLSGWDVAMMPFALNDATRFISPTKTLEYIAGGKPVVSTAVRDVVVPYGQSGIVRIADRETFASAIDAALADQPSARLEQMYHDVLSRTSWEKTWKAMSALMDPLERDAHASRHVSFVPASANQGVLECSTI